MCILSSYKNGTEASIQVKNVHSKANVALTFASRLTVLANQVQLE